MSSPAGNRNLFSLRVMHAGGTRPSVWAVGLRTLLRLVDWLPLLYLAGFITMLATGTRRQRIGDLAARTVMVRAVPVRHRSLALVPLAIIWVAAVALVLLRPPGFQVTTAGGTATLHGHGVSFSYPASWSEESSHWKTSAGNKLWTTTIGPGTPGDLILVEAYRLPISVTAQDIEAAIQGTTASLRQSGATIQGTPVKITMAGLPAFQFHAGTTSRSHYHSRLVFAFNGTTEYFVNCQYTPAKAAEVEQACNQVVGSFHVGRAGATQATPQAPQAQPTNLAEQQAQSDLAALQQADTFTGDLSTLASDAHRTHADTAAAKNDATLGAGCQVASILKTDASTARIDASTISMDRQTLNADIRTAAHDIATLKNDLSNLTASGLPAPPGAVTAIAGASRAVTQAVGQANSQIDQANADVTRVYSAATRMATSSCPSRAPGRTPARISNLSSK